MERRLIEVVRRGLKHDRLLSNVKSKLFILREANVIYWFSFRAYGVIKLSFNLSLCQYVVYKAFDYAT